METPFKTASDSSSRQLLLELGRLSIVREQQHRDTLDKHAAALENEHRQSLAVADEKRRQLREHAVAVLERCELEARLAEERQRQDEEVQLNKLRREKAERETARERERAEAERAAEAAEREAEALRKQTEQARLNRKRREDEARRTAEQQAKEEKAAKAEEERKAKEIAIEAAKQKQQLQQVTTSGTLTTTAAPEAAITPAPAYVPASASSTSAPQTPKLQQREAEHKRYLAIHQQLKQLRAFMKEQVKSNPQLKNAMSEGRRNIQKCVSQLGSDVSQNRKQLTDILATLKNSLQFQQPQIRATDYFFSPPAGVTDPTGPGLLFYFFNILAKALLAQFLGEAAIKPKAADAVGVLGSSIFGNIELLWNGHSLIDILVAKLHFLCPVLFGIYGPETTAAGKARIGWRVDPGTGAPVSQQRHFERMTGLGAGFSSIALRNFDKARASHPFPPWHFWRAMADIVNTPTEMITETHLVVLKAMLEHSEQRILDFFGSAGRAALRLALVDFPARVRNDAMAANALRLLPDVWMRDQHFYL
jgi:nucleoporin GLE1